MTLYVYGHDPASKADSYGLVIHRIEDRDEDNPDVLPIPRLQTLRAWNNIKWPEIEKQLYGYDIKDGDRLIEHVEGLFERYPPAFHVLDHTNEKSWSENLEMRFGEENTALINFTTANKLMLKQAGLRIMQMGYAFPSIDKVPEKILDPSSKKYINLRKLVEATIEQLLHEQIIPTQSGRISFDHPEGEHNDLAIAWELSIYGCLKLLIAGFGEPAAAAAKYESKVKPEEDEYFSELHRVGITITDVKIKLP